MQSLPCPRCGAFLDILDEMFGSLVECEGCRHVFTPERSPASSVLSENQRPLASRRSSYGSSRGESRHGAPSRSRSRRGRQDDFDDDYAIEDEDAQIGHKKKGSGYAVTALVLGICAIIIGIALWFICCPFVQTLLGVLSLMFGFLGMKSEGRPMAISGMICGAIACLLTFIPLIFFGALFTAAKTAPPPPPVPPPATVKTAPGSVGKTTMTRFK